jgi:hypothetical protein
MSNDAGVSSSLIRVPSYKNLIGCSVFRAKQITPVELIRKEVKSAPDAADVFSDLIRVRALELGQLCGALDLEVYLFPRSRDDLEEIEKKGTPQHTASFLLSSIRR